MSMTICNTVGKVAALSFKEVNLTEIMTEIRINEIHRASELQEAA